MGRALKQAGLGSGRGREFLLCPCLFHLILPSHPLIYSPTGDGRSFIFYYFDLRLRTLFFLAQ
jgi:hypothetical protein